MAVYNAKHGAVTPDIDYADAPMCVAGVQRVRRMTRQDNGTVAVTWWSLAGTQVFPTAPQIAAATAGTCITPVNHTVSDDCSDVYDVPYTTFSADSTQIVQNDPPYGIGAVGNMSNDSAAGNNYCAFVNNGNVPTTGTVIEFGYSQPVDRVWRFLLYNGWGNNTNDGDGIRQATFEFLDAERNVIYTLVNPPGLSSGGGTVSFVFPSELNGVRYMRMSAIGSASSPAGVRLIWLQQNLPTPKVVVPVTDRPKTVIDQTLETLGCRETLRDGNLDAKAFAVGAAATVERRVITTNPAHTWLGIAFARSIEATNIGTTNNTINGVVLLPGETWRAQGYMDKATRTFKRLRSPGGNGLIQWTASASAPLRLTVTY